MIAKADHKAVVKRIALAWTGGFDSTALLIKLLQDGYSVTVVTAKLENNSAQAYSEECARGRLLHPIKEVYPGKIDELIFTIDTIAEPRRHMLLPQAYLWLTQLPIRTDAAEIAFGYVKGDDFWRFKKYADRVAAALNGYCGDKFKFVYPFQHKKKDDLLKYYDGFPTLLPYLSVCEAGTHWLMCSCKKCVEMKRLWAKFSGHILTPDPKKLKHASKFDCVSK